MNPIKVVLAILITFVLLYAVRKASMRTIPTTEKVATYQELTLKHACTYLFKGDKTDARLDVSVDGGLLPDGAAIALYYRPRASEDESMDTAYRRVEGLVLPGQGLIYRATIPNQGRGKEFSYYFQLEDASGRILAAIPPAVLENKASDLWFRFEGRRSIPLLVVHILGMFGGLLFIVLAFMTSLENLWAKPIMIRLGKQVKWATAILFFGTFPIGIWLNYQVYATYWTGFPFGHDITDSKTLVIFVYWLFLLIMFKGSALRSHPNRDLVKPLAARILTIVGAVLSVGLYLIPHSSGSF